MTGTENSVGAAAKEVVDAARDLVLREVVAGDDRSFSMDTHIQLDSWIHVDNLPAIVGLCNSILLFEGVHVLPMGGENQLVSLYANFPDQYSAFVDDNQWVMKLEWDLAFKHEDGWKIVYTNRKWRLTRDGTTVPNGIRTYSTLMAAFIAVDAIVLASRTVKKK